MPVPLIVAAAAAAVSAASAFGGKKAYDGYQDKKSAERLNERANDISERAERRLQVAKDAANAALQSFGAAKMHIYENSLKHFSELLESIKNVKLSQAVMDEFGGGISTDEAISEIKNTVEQFSQIAGAGAAALGAGALAGYGAFGGVGMLASASTGTAISSLSGAAATNATLAWLGGGSLASGGLGIAGGTMVLGGIVSAPVLAIGGLVYSKMGEKALNDAHTNVAKAKTIAQEFATARLACAAISQVVHACLGCLQDLDGVFVSELDELARLLEGKQDYEQFSPSEREQLMLVVNLAVCISSLCKLHVLSKEGGVNEQLRKAVAAASELSAQVLAI